MADEWVIENMRSCDLTEAVTTAFGEATNLEGVGYIPLLYVGHQFVEGMNYMLICKQTLITTEPIVRIVQMTIYKKLDMPAVITDLVTIL